MFMYTEMAKSQLTKSEGPPIGRVGIFYDSSSLCEANGLFWLCLVKFMTPGCVISSWIGQPVGQYRDALKWRQVISADKKSILDRFFYSDVYIYRSGRKNMCDRATGAGYSIDILSGPIFPRIESKATSWQETGSTCFPFLFCVFSKEILRVPQCLNTAMTCLYVAC